MLHLNNFWNILDSRSPQPLVHFRKDPSCLHISSATSGCSARTSNLQASNQRNEIHSALDSLFRIYNRVRRVWWDVSQNTLQSRCHPQSSADRGKTRICPSDWWLDKHKDQSFGQLRTCNSKNDCLLHENKQTIFGIRVI